MKVFFVANSAWYLSNFRLSTLQNFSKWNEVTCLFPRSALDGDLAGYDIKKRPFFLVPESTNVLKEFLSLAHLSILLLVKRPNILFSFNPKTNLYALIACWLLRIPCVPNVSGVGAASQLSGPIGKLYRSLAGFFYRRAPHVFFQNRDDYHTFTKLGWVKAGQAEVIAGSGVDLKRFHPVARDVESVRFLMAARLIKQKGVVEYLEAAQAVLSEGKQAEFWLAGVKDHSDRAVEPQIIEQFSQQSGIEFIGHVEDMPAVLAQVDCVVLPSFYPEGIPRSLIEAAAAGKVIVTTDTPGCREVVEREQNGFLIAPQSVEALADAMQRVINLPPETRAEMQTASRALAESRFDENIVIDSYIKTAERITGESLGSPA